MFSAERAHWRKMKPSEFTRGVIHGLYLAGHLVRRLWALTKIRIRDNPYYLNGCFANLHHKPRKKAA
jgi:hypothetical protein